MVSVMLNINEKEIKNVMIFISDSLRWDYLPMSVASMGMVYKTVASSLYTASSFPSIISGLYPPRHKVFSWNDRIDSSNKGFFRNKDINTSLWCETTWTHDPPDYSDIHRILKVDKGTSLEDIEPPFIYLEDDKGGHCPYGLSFEKYGTGGCEKFFKEYSKRDIGNLRKLYAKGIDISTKNFMKRIKTLKERNLLEDTLVIFSSDHGELLGEHGGLMGHGRPPCPELVYVPTVFIHESIEPGFEKRSVLRHVDLYPTIARILGLELYYEPDGKDIIENNNKLGLNFRSGNFLKATGINKRFLYNSESVWDNNGGYVYHTMKRIKAIPFFALRILLKHPEFLYISSQSKNPISLIRNIKYSINALSNNNIRYGDPGFDLEIADLVMKQYKIKQIKWKEGERIKEKFLKKIDKSKL